MMIEMMINQNDGIIFFVEVPKDKLSQNCKPICFCRDKLLIIFKREKEWQTL